MKHTVEEMATMCEEHAGRVERALLVLHEDAKQKAAWRDEAARLRAAARAVRLVQTGIDPAEHDDGTQGEGWTMGWHAAFAALRALAERGEGK